MLFSKTDRGGGGGGSGFGGSGPAVAGAVKVGLVRREGRRRTGSLVQGDRRDDDDGNGQRSSSGRTNGKGKKIWEDRRSEGEGFNSRGSAGGSGSNPTQKQNQSTGQIWVQIKPGPRK